MVQHDYEVTGDGVIIFADDTNQLPKDYGESEAYREYRRKSKLTVDNLPRRNQKVKWDAA